MSEKLRKKIFYILMAAAFLSVLIYAFLTPNMSDDLNYGRDVAKAENFFDLFKQEHEHYMNHGGRSVAHFILRVFLFMGTKSVFNVVSAVVFTILTLLIYANVDMRRKYDIRVYVVVLGFLWLLDPTISQTVFWEDGACNYLFTTTILLGFMTYFRKCMIAEKKNSLALMIVFSVWGILSGWCNENTSGGVILFLLVLLYLKWREKKSLSFIKTWMICGLIGSCTGFLIMFLSPSNFTRGSDAASKEAHSGLLGIMARFLKIILNIKENYIVLTLMFVVLLILIRSICASKEKYSEVSGFMKVMGFIALISALALIAVPEGPQLRAYYGASIFLMIAVINGIAVVGNMAALTVSAEDSLLEKLIQGLYTSAVVVMGIWLSFVYIEQGALVARVNREYKERYDYLERQAAAGVEDVEVPMLRPQWYSKYTDMAYECDIVEGWVGNEEDPRYGDYYVNRNVYCEQYGFDSLTGVEREGWTEY